VTKHKTYKTLEDYRDYLVKDNNWAFMESWNYTFTSPRIEIVNVMDIQSGQDIIDVGCADGRTLEYIKNNYNANLYGIEPDKDAAKQAGKHAKIFPITIEEFLKTNDQEFDLIIMADVIEHLKESWIVVRELGNRLKKGGYIYASIPNFFNATVMMNLFIYGTFGYASNDIVNKEHLRFFTFQDVMALFQICGLQPEMLGGLGAQMPEGAVGRAEQLGKVFGRTDYNFDIYQFVLRASK